VERALVRAGVVGTNNVLGENFAFEEFVAEKFPSGRKTFAIDGTGFGD